MTEHPHTTTAGSNWVPPTVGVPSWLVSITTHAFLFFLFATTLKSCSSGGLSGDQNFRRVGLVARESDERTNPDEIEPETADESTDAARSVTSPDQGAASETPNLDPSEVEKILSLPNTTIGAGGIAPVSPADNAAGELRPSGLRPTAPPSGIPTGREGATFFGTNAEGKKIVFVLDCSSSMGTHGEIKEARNEAKASLSRLSEDQYFQIIFYNQVPRDIPRPKGQPKLFRATDINRTLAGEFMDRIVPDGATKHIPALKMALAMKPDAIFFLTDADEPTPRPDELEALKRRNGGHTQIHCIEFGRGAKLSRDNFLKQIARQNAGTYRYIDVKQLKGAS